jgi:hypothetical protein
VPLFEIQEKKSKNVKGGFFEILAHCELVQNYIKKIF